MCPAQETSLYKSEYDRVRLKEYSRFHGYAYDGIWAIALAIQAVDKKLRMRNSHLSIEDFQYRDPFWAQLFREALNETHFDGVTVNVPKMTIHTLLGNYGSTSCTSCISVHCIRQLATGHWAATHVC